MAQRSGEAVVRLLDNVRQKTMAIFFADSSSRIEKIEAALREMDYQTIRFEAHSIKSAAITLGAMRLGIACKSIENACDKGNMDTASRISLCLKTLLEDTRKAFIENPFASAL
ncbi:MAG: Hpt domain-containing protein [Candidatus Methylumidiphilus sp.]